MWFLCTLALSLSVTLPPPGRIATFGSDDDWAFVPVDMQRGADLLTEFSKSYDGTPFHPDFPVNPIRKTRDPQGLLGFRDRAKRIRALVHVVQPNLDAAFVTFIATPHGASEVPQALLPRLRAADGIVVDADRLRMQPRWLLLSRHYR